MATQNTSGTLTLAAARPATVSGTGSSGSIPANYRWLFTDSVVPATYRVPRNPNQMTNPFGSKSIDTLPGGPVESRIRARMGVPTPHEWRFGGTGEDQDHHDQLLAWSQKEYPIDITDHLGRTFTVVITKFDYAERRPSAQRPWKFTYEMTTLVLGRA
jgi:hypothetical protein